MRSVGLKVLKNRLSEFIRMAAGGETVLVTDRDKIVAEIVPHLASIEFLRENGQEIMFATHDSRTLDCARLLHIPIYSL
jgi:antitoxin (DNA-binding transcriptional repressor) of toxin-antitoxin stability system